MINNWKYLIRINIKYTVYIYTYICDILYTVYDKGSYIDWQCIKTQLKRINDWNSYYWKPNIWKDQTLENNGAF